MKTTRKRIAFADLPGNYAGLCGVLTPRPIRDHLDYDNTMEIVETMALWEKKFSRDQEDYFDVLCTLIEAWQKDHLRWRKVSPLHVLRHLMEEHGMSGADLSRFLGGSRQLGPMILREERSITADHARVLGKHFGLPSGVFIGEI